MEGILYLGGPHSVLLGLNTSLSLILFNLGGNKGITRKGIKILIEMLILNLAEELGFREA